MPQTSLVGWLFKSKASSSKDESPVLGAPMPPNQTQQSNGTFTHEDSIPKLKSSSTVPSSNLPPLPKKYAIQRCSEQFITAFRRLNALLLPIPYQDSFYDETLKDTVISSVTRFAIHNVIAAPRSDAPNSDAAMGGEGQNGQLAGAIRCRLLYNQTTVSPAQPPVLYISTIGILAPHRGYGLASHLLEEVSQAAIQEFGINAVMAHVWEANEDALHWYKKRGFVIVAKEGDYYRRLAPRTGAWLIRKDV